MEPDCKTSEASSRYRQESDAGLAHFRNMRYSQAIPHFEAALDVEGTSPKQRLIAIKNVADCYYELMAANWEQSHEEYLDEYNRYLSRYEEALRGTPFEDIAPDVIEIVLAKAIRVFSRTESPDRFADRSRALMRSLLEGAQGKVTAFKLYQVMVGVLDEIRRDVAARDRSAKVKALGHALLNEVEGDEPAYASLRSAVNVILADTQYFIPDLEQQDNWAAVEAYLDAALRDSPKDPFAQQFRRNISTLRYTDLQLRGFLHDASKRIGYLRNRFKEVKQAWPDNETPSIALTDLENELEVFYSIAELVQLQGKDRIGEPRRGDAETVDISELLRQTVSSYDEAEQCVLCEGEPERWVLWRGFVLLAVSNLITNTQEAYRRRNIAPPSPPFRLSVDYETKVVTYRDWAGGIAQGMPDIFGPFVSEKPVQILRGIGLPRARAAMQAQGFDLRLAEQQPDDGAAFVLDFNRRM